MNNINTFNHHTSFQAYKVGTAKNFLNNKQTTIDIYKLTKSDKNFIDKLEKFINLSKLDINIKHDEKTRWQQILNYGFAKAKDFLNTISYIAFSENKPCGLLVTYKDKNNLCLDCVSKFPLEENKDKNYIGKSLFYQLFKIAKENNYNNIFLQAVAHGPFDVTSKYKKIGFKEIGYTDCYVNMECNKNKINNILKELSKNIIYKEIHDSKNVDLNEIYDII